MAQHEPSYEQWIDHVFDHPVTSPEWYWELDSEDGDVNGELEVEYLTKLFEQPAFLAKRFEDKQLNQGLWYLLGCCTQRMYAIRNEEIGLAKRLRLVRSLSSLYELLFSEYCSSTLSQIDEQPSNALNSVCYMMWDMDGGLGYLDEPLDEIDLALLSVLREALQSQNDAVVESALHGLGEAGTYRLEQSHKIVEEFLALRGSSIRKELVTYAIAAKTTGVL